MSDNLPPGCTSADGGIDHAFEASLEELVNDVESFEEAQILKAILPIIRSSIMQEYLVWSHEHSAWWRPERAGYTTFVEAAGRYSRNEALRICAHARDGWRSDEPPPEIPVCASDVAAIERMKGIR